MRGWPLGLAAAGLLLAAGPPQVRRPPQAFLARQLLLEAAQGHEKQAYARLDSTGRHQLSRPEFAALVRQLRAHQQQFGPRFSLYRLGFRLPDFGPVEYFYSFTFDADTLGPAPHVVLDVSYPDSMATQPQRIRILPGVAAPKR